MKVDKFGGYAPFEHHQNYPQDDRQDTFERGVVGQPAPTHHGYNAAPVQRNYQPPSGYGGGYGGEPKPYHQDYKDPMVWDPPEQPPPSYNNKPKRQPYNRKKQMARGGGAAPKKKKANNDGGPRRDYAKDW